MTTKMSIAARRLLLATALAAPSGAQSDVFGYEVGIRDFDNGLRVVTVPTDFPGIVSVHCIVAVGSRHEVEPGKSGFAHFFEHMMFRGTKNRTAAEQAAIFKAAGADRNAYTTDDYTDYHTTVPAEELETVLKLEADRFQNLQYSEKAFRTEAMAVLGEYNKNSANPVEKLFETIRDTAFSRHTYKHTTMGFLRDIRTMPRQYDYSLRFFDRFYRPEYVTILVVGDVEVERVEDLVQKYWADWKRGSYVPEIPAEPAQTEPLTCHIKWPAPTQPWVVVAFKGPAFSRTAPDMATLDVLSSLAFSESSEIYRKLYVRDRKVDVLAPYFPDQTDPSLVMILARVKDPADWATVRDEILAECERLKTELVDTERLEVVKSNLRYSFASGLSSSSAIAASLAGFIARTRTPATVNDVYRMYAGVSSEAIRAAARKYFVPTGRTIATLSHEPLPPEPEAAAVDVPGVFLPTSSSLVSFRIAFETGAMDDREGKEGLAYITAQMLAAASTKRRSYEQLLEAMYPMAAGVGVQVDKELTVFQGTVHRDNVEAYFELLREMLREPAFAEADLERIKSNTISALDVGLRRSDDEELGKEVLFGEIFAGHPYEHHNLGAIESIRGITVDDVRSFYRGFFHRAIIGLAGGYPKDLPGRVWSALNADVDPEERLFRRTGSRVAEPRRIERNRMTIVQKSALATGLHIGFPTEVTRMNPDWIALWLARSWLGEHRSENSHLYQRLREVRGLNYGDYAYIEYFPNGGAQFQPDPNLVRKRQVFQIWIRPVPPVNGPFALKAAYYEFGKLVRDGLTEAQFEATRDYLSKYCALLVATDDRRLGYALDSEWYRTDEFVKYVRDGLARLTVDDVNRAIKQHWRTDRLQFVVVTEDAEGFRDAILSDEPTPISYQAQPDQSVLEEDAIIERIKIPLRAEDVKIVPVDRVFVR